MKLIDGINQFALDSYHSLKKEKEENFFFSPFSISFALAMAYAGARGETREQMAKVLHFERSSKQICLALNEVSRSLKEIDESKIYGDAQAFKLNLANSIWGQEGYEYKSDFRELLLKYYGTDLKLQDFIQFPEKARQEINRWVSKETEKKIRDLIPAGGINDMTRLVLANAIYFFASWATPFWKNSTQDDNFFLLNGGKVKVPMMKMVEYISIIRGQVSKQ
jgi:serpin B